jgi:Ca2+-transporting ATPase
MVIYFAHCSHCFGCFGVVEGEGLMETFVILGILVINAVIGTVQEKKAQASWMP